MQHADGLHLSVEVAILEEKTTVSKLLKPFRIFKLTLALPLGCKGM